LSWRYAKKSWPKKALPPDDPHSQELDSRALA
jgi:hypothetical protein